MEMPKIEVKRTRIRFTGEPRHRFSLDMPLNYRLYLEEKSGQAGKSVSKYINSLIEADMEKYAGGGESHEGIINQNA